jgi:SH3-like domain-containing protein
MRGGRAEITSRKSENAEPEHFSTGAMPMQPLVDRLFALIAMAVLALLALLSPALGGQIMASLPRFASLKADEVPVRKGPGKKYPVIWTYNSIGLPVKIVKAAGEWRLARDSGGGEGWIHARLLSALRMALAAPWEKKQIIISMRKRPDENAPVAAKLEPGVKALVKSCDGQWCHLSVSGIKGWVRQNRLWGVFPGEIVR